VTLPFTAPGERRSLRWVTVVIWISLSIAILAAARTLPWDRTFALLQRVQPGWIAVALAGNLAILPLWAAEWRILTPVAMRPPFSRMWEVVTVSAAVLNTIPFLAGEASAIALLMERAGLTRGAALSVLALDQLLVAFAKLLVIAIAAIGAPLPEWLQAGVASLGIAFLALFLGLVALAHRWSALAARLGSAPGRMRQVGARVLGWGEHFETLREGRRALLVMALAVAKKAAELAAIVAVQLAFGLDPSITWALLVLAALAITTLLPVSPANLGVYEATVYATYRFVGVAPEAAIGMAIVQHLCFLLPPVGVGYAMLTTRQWSRR
jgi:uncharacterized protein (TIRG00374 family)